MPGLTAEAPARAVGRYQLDTEVGRLTPAERAARGKAARAEVPRNSHAVFDPPADRPDPIALLEQQATIRVPDQNERDYQALVDAAKSGRITAEHGL